MAHLAQREERQHVGNEVKETIFGGLVHHEVHQHVNADTSEDENTVQSRLRALLRCNRSSARMALKPASNDLLTRLASKNDN
jgi:hypothetical protein